VFIVYTKHEHIDPSVDGGMLNRWWGELIIKGTKEAEIYPGLAPQQEEPVISKRRYSAFFGTELDSLLRLRGIEDLIISGVMTNLCCESTARDGFMHDFRIFFLQDATSTINKDLHLATLKNLAYGFAYVITLSELKRAWRI
jgi:isochorismate hydrolase